MSAVPDLNDLHRQGRLPASPMRGKPIEVADPDSPSAVPDDDVPVDTYEQMAKREGVFETVVPESGVEMKPAIVAAMENMQERAKRGNVLAGLSTGYPKLDKAMDGLQRGKVYVVGARSGMGKSIFSMNVALNVARLGHRVLYFTLEMPVEELVIMSLFCWSAVASHRLRAGTLRAEDWSALTTAAQLLCKMPFRWDESVGLTIEEIDQRVAKGTTDRPEGVAPIELVVIDHALLISPSNTRQPRREQMIHITKSIKNMAKRRNVAVLALDQLNRASEARTVKDKRPVIGDLKESGSFEEDADAVLLLFRQDKYEKDRGKHNHELEVIMPKIRGHVEAYAKLKFTGDIYRVDNIEETPTSPDATAHWSDTDAGGDD